MKTIKRTLAYFVVAGALAGVASARPVVTAVLNGASYSAVVSPGCWVAIFGTGLALSVARAETDPLPTKLAEVSVTVGGRPAPLRYVSPRQINALIPFEVKIPGNPVVRVIVNSPGGSYGYNIRLTRNAPAIFTQNGAGTGRALVFDSNFRHLGIVGAQDTVILYATGLGPTKPSDGFDRVVDDVKVYLGELQAEVLSAGLAPGFPGIYQLNVKAPAPAIDRLYLRSGDWQSNIAEIGIRSGANTANVSGTIDGLFPSPHPNFPKRPNRECQGNRDRGPCGPLVQGQSLSVMLHAGSFTVAFDILPSAKPFDVAAVGEGGGSIISINPAAGTYTASVHTTTPAAVLGDFSGLSAPVWDYLSCEFTSAACRPFPQNRIPLSRMSKFWVSAVRTLPTPNTPVAPSPNSSFQVSGKLSGSRFAVDNQTNSELSRFGGFVQVPYSSFPVPVSTFRLYVDGRLVASKDLPYLVFHRAQEPYVEPCNNPNNYYCY
jgi:uncharacterized protein (TIGR03437 family)